MCIKGYLKEKTCILITHQIQFLANVDHILLMENASIKSTGSYHELIDYGFDFSKLLGFPEETIVESHIKCENANKKKLNTNHTLSRSGDNIKSFINRDTVKPMKEEEAHCSGHVSKKIYLSYYSSCGSIIKIVFIGKQRRKHFSQREQYDFTQQYVNGSRFI
ncbi:P-loop containing nucleoside triphosphate hydrolase [Cinara cedri]|uniref:P-loop containing nucleoside triphosphate hydrolase n=1 Tax=Cinara cedri TaxID=506608 RepID=A0A5E4NLB6_9HEMI|nr:P-loop containing nucleoside triphosphate hydrolase [Cinara cedri]